MSKPEVKASYKVKGTSKVVLVLCGATTLSQILTFPTGSKIVGYDREITPERAIEITGNRYSFTK